MKKLTVSELRNLIKEEIDSLLNEEVSLSELGRVKKTLEKLGLDTSLVDAEIAGAQGKEAQRRAHLQKAADHAEREKAVRWTDEKVWAGEAERKKAAAGHARARARGMKFIPDA